MSEHRELAEVIYDLAKVAAREEFGSVMEQHLAATNAILEVVAADRRRIDALEEDVASLREHAVYAVPPADTHSVKA